MGLSYGQTSDLYLKYAKCSVFVLLGCPHLFFGIITYDEWRSRALRSLVFSEYTTNGVFV
jgi:hypothetical protein